jgi:uncharacterized protein
MAIVTRRLFLSSVSVAGMGVPAYGCIESRWLEKVIQPVVLSKVERRIRILHLSDLHFSRFVPIGLIDHAIDIGLAEKPDIIVVTGDFISDSQEIDLDRYVRSLKRLSAAAPAFATLGNHDGGSWTTTIGGYPDSAVVQKLLGKSGLTLLQNDLRKIELNGQRIQLIGVGDLWNGGVDPDSAFAAVDDQGPIVLLAHNPDTKDHVGNAKWDLMLSGHTHGGQVLVPVVGTHFVPVKDKRFIAGLKFWNDRQVYITRGVGSLGGIRVNCRPEVTVLDLMPKTAQA